jgi:hypothetical protein
VHRRRSFRVLGLSMALWFLALFSGVGGLDVCPMDQAMDAAVAVFRANLATPHVRLLQSAPDGPLGTPPAMPMLCSCIGTCTGSPMASLPALSDVPIVMPPVASTAGAVEQPAGALPPPDPFILPPANGPPPLHTS